MQSTQKTCDLHEKMAATRMFHFSRGWKEGGGGGGGFKVEESFDFHTLTPWREFWCKLDPPSFLPPLFTLLVKSTLLIVGGGAEKSRSTCKKLYFLFFGIYFQVIYLLLSFFLR